LRQALVLALVLGVQRQVMTELVDQQAGEKETSARLPSITPAIAQQARREKADVFFWVESGFRADAVHGKTWDVRGKTPGFTWQPESRRA